MLEAGPSSANYLSMCSNIFQIYSSRNLDHFNCKHHDTYNKIFSLVIEDVKGLALPKLFSSMFFGWYMFCNPFPHLLIWFSILQTLSNCIPILLIIQICYLNPFSTLSCSFEILCSLPKFLSIIHLSAFPHSRNIC